MRKVLIHIFLLVIGYMSVAQNSVLNEGTWYKVAVDHNGVYKITRDQLGKMGFSGAVDPRNIRIYGFENEMLPQANSIERPDDLEELSIYVEGESDGVFDNNDFILFYARGPSTQTFIPGKNVFLLQSNLYSDKNYYFITAGSQPGKRLSQKEAGTGGVSVTSYHDYIVHEENSINILRSGREWFGENFELDPEKTFDVDVPGIVNNSVIKLVSEVMSQSFNPSSFEIFYNGQSIGIQDVAVIPDSPYAAKGKVKRDTLTFNASAVSATATSRQSIRYKFNRAPSQKSVGFLNFFSVHYERKLELRNDQTIFRNGDVINALAAYSVENVTSGDHVWNITDPLNPLIQQVNSLGSNASFSFSASDKCEEFIVFNRSIPSPELIGDVSNQNLRGLSTPELIIVTHPDFEAEANRLAGHRRTHNGLDVTVVTTNQVFNEFSSGRQDVTAIRDFTRWLYKKNPTKLKSLLLFGKSSYDYLDRIKNNINFVPTYEARNSLSPLETFSSDDYFSFLEDSEGEWIESAYGSHSSDVGVGRLPVKSLEEARVVVDKLIEYDQAQNRFGDWRKEIVFVADDGSNSDGFSSIHQSQANSMAEEIENLNQEFNTRKIFLGSYTKKVSPNGETIPNANLDIAEEFSEALIINYTGHGSEKLWADERVLTPAEIDNLRNDTYPFLVTATCEFGRHDDPVDISSAESSLLKENGGSIGLVTTTRPVNSSTNFELNQAFYEALFQKENGSWLSVGEIFRRTKNNSTSGVANRNFSLLGDPSMTLALPNQSITIDEIKTESGSDTLKALSNVWVRGRVVDESSQTDIGFSGTVQASLFDKRTEFQTIGKNNPVFKYTQWYNALFRGQASVKDGAFEFSFVLPKNIAYEVNAGKLSLYAFNATKERDATGASSTFKIGGSESDPVPDDKSPDVYAFMGDTTFVGGGTVSPNTMLVVKMFDDNGMNISNYGIGNTMMALLDDQVEVFLLNEHFMTEKDNFRKGWVHFPLYNLSPGRHTITVRAWDTYNNPGESIVDFVVSDGDTFEIEEWSNYPNPFHAETTLYFTHNRPGQDLLAEVTVLNASGSEVGKYHANVPGSTFKVDLLKLRGGAAFGKKLTPGLYFARLRVRSVTDGAESSRVTKLILAN